MPALRVRPLVAVLGGTSDLQGARPAFAAAVARSEGTIVTAAHTGIATLVAATAATATLGTASAARPLVTPPDGPEPRPVHHLVPPRPPSDPARAAARPRSAPRIEELAARIGLRRLREIRAQAVADLNQAATQSFGSFDAVKAAVLDRRAYFDDQDVDVFVTEDDPQRLSYVAVPVGFVVGESGEVVLPGPDPGAYSAPAFDGPWGTATTAFFTATNTDGGGVSCGSTTARTIVRASWLPLADHSASRDFWGVDLAAVAEVTGTSGCNDYVDGARIGFRSTTPGAAVVAEDPVSGRTQACSTRRVTVGASWGGVSGSVAQDFTQCERIGVSGALHPATTTRLVIFDNNRSCHAGDRPFDGRELAQVGVIEVPQGRGPGLVLAFGADAGNADTCKEDLC